MGAIRKEGRRTKNGRSWDNRRKNSAIEYGGCVAKRNYHGLEKNTKSTLKVLTQIDHEREQKSKGNIFVAKFREVPLVVE